MKRDGLKASSLGHVRESNSESLWFSGGLSFCKHLKAEKVLYTPLPRATNVDSALFGLRHWWFLMLNCPGERKT